MLTRIAIGLMAGTLLSAPVLAQTSPGQAPASNAPAATTQSQPMTQSSGASAQGGSIQYITQNRPDLWRASRLEGIDVYNQSNEKIGDISEVLVDRQGRVEAVVIGVGGFLGIGERSVAVPFNSLQWTMEDPARTASNTGTATQGTAATGASNNTMATNNAPAGSATGTTAGSAPSTTGTVATGTVATGNTSAGDQMRDYPARAILPNATKDQLKNAPEFRFSSR